MGVRLFAIGLCVAPSVALAQMDALTCQGSRPDWALGLADDTTRFAFGGRTTDMTIPQRSTPQGADWPLAITLIGLRDSAIVIPEAPTVPQPVRILTQRGETPLLLVGSCTPDE